MPGASSRLVAAAAVAAVAVQVGPAATWLPGVRRRLGRPDEVALTFDDGPHPEGTPAVLDALDALGWRSTFFVLGSAARAHPDVLREVVARGHEVALHGDDHRYLIARSPGAARDDVRRGHDTVAEIAGSAPRWWRPPYGVLSGPALAAATGLGLRPLLWSAWGRDWRAAATPGSVVADATRGEPGGGTILLHDSDVTSDPGAWRTTVAALPLLAERLGAAGVSVTTVGEHLRS